MNVTVNEELMASAPMSAGSYQRYHIETKPAPDIVPWPSRFEVNVSRVGLARLLLKELVQYRGNLDVVLSRPCVYGVFSGPLGGFLPRQDKCVGCLRCTTQYPNFVEIRHNPKRQRLGDTYFTFLHVNAIAYEASTGTIPVKGAGYRGKFGGDGWDGMWTDMSEIVRPTRDGIHGREFISTVVDIGRRPAFLTFDPAGRANGNAPHTFDIPLPIIFDAPPPAVAGDTLIEILAETAESIRSLSILPLNEVLAGGLHGPHIVPLVASGEAAKVEQLSFEPRLIEMDGWDATLYQRIRARFPASLICLRLPFAEAGDLLQHVEQGIPVFHLTANYHGETSDGRFVFDLIREAHGMLVNAGIRGEVTLIGSGGIIAAEHVPKAIIAGLDAVALDTALLVGLQAEFSGDFTDRLSENCRLPGQVTEEWGVQRLKNMMAAWHDQLLEILGAMGLREVRRLRGEMGRAMFQKELERQAFAGIEGFDD